VRRPVIADVVELKCWGPRLAARATAPEQTDGLSAFALVPSAPGIRSRPDRLRRHASNAERALDVVVATALPTPGPAVPVQEPVFRGMATNARPAERAGPLGELAPPPQALALPTVEMPVERTVPMLDTVAEQTGGHEVTPADELGTSDLSRMETWARAASGGGVSRSGQRTFRIPAVWVAGTGARGWP
jgi:hypothetical protein